ncbi:MAG: CMP/dCMP kinase, partial [Thermoleophilaceae bacterium]|nr:CMP/dCMP kinase [Thermoleophilaceae bacterium]
MVVAIDGPAGAGKSTVARALADALGFAYLDTGALYRAVGLAVAENGGDPAERARAATIEFDPDGRVMLDGRDVTRAIRTPEASEGASRVATLGPVREALVDKQRALLTGGGD